jgi:hypothetical protein
MGCKWVNIKELSERLRPRDSIERIKYFTALVEKRVDDPDQRNRQRTYWRALDTLGIVQRIEGKFIRHAKYMPLCSSVEALERRQAQGCSVVGVKPQTVRVMRTEEKGSDVNLAVHLVHDAHQALSCNTFEVALVISTDADLAEAVRIVVHEIGKPVYVCRPRPRIPTRKLDRAATGVFDLPPSALRASQFPASLRDAKGRFHRPATW